VDRVPIIAPIPWSPLWRIRDRWPTDWRASPNFRTVWPLAEEHCDAMVRIPLGTTFDYRYLFVPDEYIEPEEPEGSDGHFRRRTIVRTPRGELGTVEEWDVGVGTVWCTEPLLKDRKDVGRILSVPYRFSPPDLSAFHELRDDVGDRAVPVVKLYTPILCVSRLLGFHRFLEWCVAERDVINRLVRTAFERTRERLQWLLEAGVGPIFRIGGSEQAIPPVMSPRLYDELVAGYDVELIDMIHRYGCLAHVHCHGKISGILDKLVEMGADALDPVEPPPHGDIEMGEAKRRVAGGITLFGNIEFQDLEFAGPEEIEVKVKRAILDGGKEHTVLYTSATAISALSDRHRENAIRYIEAGLRYGRF